MVRTPGSLYFLRERDFLSGNISPYVKIGLVRNDKKTASRIAEHQTGNPREIMDFQTIAVPFVEELETRLHYLYGTRWIAGEWFLLHEAELKEVITVAKQYVRRQEKLKQAYVKLDEFEQIPSNGLLKVPDRKDIEIWRALKRNKEQLIQVDAQAKFFDLQLRLAMGNYRGIEGVISTQIKTIAASFDKAAFLAADNTHPNLLSAYNELKQGGLASQWGIKQISKLQELDPELAERIKSLPKPKLDAKDMKKKALKRQPQHEEWHEQLILASAQKAQIEWDLIELETELKLRVADCDGITDLCSWTRTIKEDRFEPNLAAFKQAHPDLVMRFQKPESNTVSLLIHPHRSYPLR